MIIITIIIEKLGIVVHYRKSALNHPADAFNIQLNVCIIHYDAYILSKEVRP